MRTGIGGIMENGSCRPLIAKAITKVISKINFRVDQNALRRSMLTSWDRHLACLHYFLVLDRKVRDKMPVLRFSDPKPWVPNQAHTRAATIWPLRDRSECGHS